MGEHFSQFTIISLLRAETLSSREPPARGTASQSSRVHAELCPLHDVQFSPPCAEHRGKRHEPQAQGPHPPAGKTGVPVTIFAQYSLALCHGGGGAGTGW